MRLVEPKVPSSLFGEALVAFLIDAANQYADAQQWRLPTIAAHFEQYCLDAADAEIIETCEFLAWRCELANTWIEAELARGRPEHELTWQACINETGVVEPDGRFRVKLPADWWQSPLMPPRH